MSVIAPASVSLGCAPCRGGDHAACDPRPCGCGCVGPQRGAQAAFLGSAADIAIGGGSAGGGKTWALLLEPLRHVDGPGANPDFGCAVLRREMPQVLQEGGLWGESAKLYRPLGARARESPVHEWRFPSGARVAMTHCQHETDRFNFDGGQLALLGIDQLEGFTATIFWHLWSRLRWAGDPRRPVRPYLRGTCNPVPEDDPVGGWLHRLLQWWIDPATGYAIPERSGRVRWFVRDETGDEFLWGDDPAALAARHGGARPVSLSFVRMERKDNPALTAKDPDYDAKLHLLPRVERERLALGNWNVKPTAGLVFDRVWFDVLRGGWPADATGRPVGVAQRVRAWDKAGTEGGGKWSAGARVALTTEGVFVVEDVARGRWSAGHREAAIDQCAASDPPGTVVWVEQEPGSGGKESAELTVRRLAQRGIEAHAERPTGSKLDRSGSYRSAAEARLVKLLPGPWNEAFLSEHHHWSGDEREVCDQIDAAGHAYRKLALRAAGEVEIVRLRGF